MGSSLSQRINKVGGWLSLGQAKVLERLARGQVVMEIGSYFGKSTIAMAPAAKKLICIDYFLTKVLKGHFAHLKDKTGRLIIPSKKPDTRNIFERNVEPWRHKIEIYEMNSLDAVKLTWEPVGLLFIDGGHDYATVLSDCGFLRWVVVGGHVAFHDVKHKDIARAIKQEVSNNLEWKKVQGASNLAVYRRISG